jgi:hypothetical protein
MVVQTCNCSSEVAQAEGWRVQGQSGIDSRLCLRKEKNKINTSYERIISGPWESLPF